MSIGTTQLQELITHLWHMTQADRYAPLCIWGEAGIGKSQGVRAAAERLGIDFVDLRLGNMEAPDLMGQMRDDLVYPCLFDLQDPDSAVLAASERWSRNGLWNHVRVKHPEKIPPQLMDRPIEFVDWLLDQTEKAGFGTYFENRTVYSAPEWFPAPDTAGILFLDEMNRSAKETRQGVFQLILDRRIHELELPPGWLIVSANNPSRSSMSASEVSGYDVDPLEDRAFLDRFLHVVLLTTKEEWLDYAARKGVDLSIRMMIKNSPDKVLGLSHETELPQMEPTPRSWEVLSRILTPVPVAKGRARELPRDLLMPVCQGKLGQETGTQFAQWLQEVSAASHAWPDAGEHAPVGLDEVVLERATDLVNDAAIDPDLMTEAVAEAAQAIGGVLRVRKEDLGGRYAQMWWSAPFIAAVAAYRAAPPPDQNPLAKAGAKWLAEWYAR